jgi:hypothetical protein
MILNGKFVDKHGEMYGGMVWLRRVRYDRFNRYSNSEVHGLRSNMCDPRSP